MKPISPGLSKPAEHTKWPSLEHKGHWTRLDGWDADCYTALRRTLLKFDTHGDFLSLQILWLFNSGLNLPMQSDNDWRLLVECIENHDANMREMFPSGPKAWVKAFTAASVAACYQEQIEAILGVE